MPPGQHFCVSRCYLVATGFVSLGEGYFTQVSWQPVVFVLRLIVSCFHDLFEFVLDFFVIFVFVFLGFEIIKRLIMVQFCLVQWLRFFIFILFFELNFETKKF